MYLERAMIGTGHRVITPELAGYGNSGGVVVKRTLVEHAHDITDLLDEPEVDRATQRLSPPVLGCPFTTTAFLPDSATELNRPVGHFAANTNGDRARDHPGATGSVAAAAVLGRAQARRPRRRDRSPSRRHVTATSSRDRR